MARSSSLNLVFVDATINALQIGTGNVVPQAEVLTLTADQDGIEQITAALAARSHIQSLHILSLGGSGSLQLGATQLTLFNLDRYGWQLQQWGESLIPGAEIVFHDLASTSDASTSQFSAPFLNRLHLLTGAKITLLNLYQNQQEMQIPAQM
jgi:hypothetical protein